MNGERERVLSVWDVVKEMQKIMNEHVRLSWNQYREIKELYGNPYRFWKDALSEFFPQSSDKFLDLFNRWFEEQIAVFEKNVESALNEPQKGMPFEEYSVPASKEFQSYVDEHVGLWLKNYRKLTASREEYDRAALEFLKSVFPETMHPLLENANRWKREQTERIEREVLGKLEKQGEKKQTASKPKKKGK